MSDLFVFLEEGFVFLLFSSESEESGWMDPALYLHSLDSLKDDSYSAQDNSSSQVKTF